jgi:hypothetical protein
MQLLSMTKRILGATIALMFALAGTAFGQGVTTAALNGFVDDSGGKAVAGVTVTAVHTPTNTTYTSISTSAGRFSFTGIPVGGPYTVSAKADGYSMNPLTGVQTSLGESTDVILVLKSAAATEQVVTMQKFEVKGEVSDLDGNTAGAGTVLSNTRIAAQPNPGRTFADLIKTNPFATIRAFPQVEALGMSSRYNTITLDGAKINDSFGLNASGLFSLNNPFSIDAIDQLSVSLTPYDVRQSGFAGASINAVSKSGTNEFHGSAYFQFTDANWQGADIYGPTKGTRAPLKERTYGYTLGGPILKNRLFFFGNIEKFYRDTAPTVAAFTPDPTFLAAVNTRLAQLPGAPNLGTFGGVSTTRTTDVKRLLKLDWNIIEGHRASVRYSDTVGLLPVFSSFNSTSFSQPVSFIATVQPTSFPNGLTSLTSNFYTINVKEKVIAGQLFDNWTPDFKTQFNYSSTKQDSVRVIPPFPEIRIFGVPGISNTGATITSGDGLRMGGETSSMGNELHVKTNTLGGSGDYTWNDFTFTAGADHEKSDYLNLFRQGSYGFFDYANLAAFQADTPAGFARAVVTTGIPVADVSTFEQTGIYGQLKWQPTSQFNVMLGLRVDYMKAPLAPPYNAGFATAFGVTNAGTIDGTNTPAPRLSFNYALDRERTTQIRGGVGVFLGRNPWVWISNSYGNFGLGRFTVQTPLNATDTTALPTLNQYLAGTFSNTDPAYKFDPANPIGRTNIAPSASTVQVINLIKPGLKMPTVQRGNLAIDHKLPALNAVLSVEYIETTQLDALFVDNMNLKPTGAVGIDGRTLFAGPSSTAPIIPGYGNVIRTRNVHAGASQYVAITLDHPMKGGLAYNVAYTHGHATEAQTLNSSTANSNWQFNPVFNQGRVEVARSDYEMSDRLQASVSREFHFLKDFVSTVSLYYEGHPGQIYSYVYANDLNGDGFSTDLLTIPTGPNDPHFDFSGMTATQQAAYFAFINSSGLSKYAGTYAPRNSMTTPWQNRLDLRFVQEIPAYRRAKLEVFADFINLGFWLNSHLFNYIQTINTSATNGGLTRSFGAATYVNGLIKPTFNNGTTAILGLDPSNNLTFASSSSVVQPSNGTNRWSIQAGIRLKF